MKRITSLLTQDDAVSSVIGVILLVTITVIMAAFAATFVLAVGEEETPAPTANFEITDDGPPGGTIQITLKDGDELEASNVYIRGQELDVSGRWDGAPNGEVDSGVIKAGYSAEVIAINGEWVVNVVWEDPDPKSDTTVTLATEEGRDR